jgi:hypothetical protein
MHGVDVAPTSSVCKSSLPGQNVSLARGRRGCRALPSLVGLDGSVVEVPVTREVVREFSLVVTPFTSAMRFNTFAIG